MNLHPNDVEYNGVIYVYSDDGRLLGPKTPAEYEALTDEDRAAWAAMYAEFDARAAAEAAPSDRARAASAEKNRPVVLVFCKPCRDRDPIAVVRPCTRGFVFDGRDVTKPDPDRLVRQSQVEAEMRRNAEELGVPAPKFGRYRFPEGRVQVIITERRESGTDWPPRCACPMHDPDEARVISPRTLLKAAHIGRAKGKPAIIILGRDGTATITQ